jgi:hypothetical protein
MRQHDCAESFSAIKAAIRRHAAIMVLSKPMGRDHATNGRPPCKPGRMAQKHHLNPNPFAWLPGEAIELRAQSDGTGTGACGRAPSISQFATLI